MDRISKAIEKARQQRAKNAGKAPATNEVSNISYTKTKTVLLDTEVLKGNGIITDDDQDEYMHAYKVLRTRIWQKMKDKGWSSLAVTSCNPGEGKTITSINLALSLAMMKANHSVLLVDMDLRRPSIKKYLGLNVTTGMSDYLVNGVPLAETLVNPGIGRFVILPGNKPVYNSSEILSSARMEHLVQDFKTRYPSRLVIFDLPPLLAADDVLVFMPYVDAVLLVIEDGKTSTDDLKQVKNVLGMDKLIGTVLNKSRDVISRYY